MPRGSPLASPALRYWRSCRPCCRGCVSTLGLNTRGHGLLSGLRRVCGPAVRFRRSHLPRSAASATSIPGSEGSESGFSSPLVKELFNKWACVAQWLHSVVGLKSKLGPISVCATVDKRVYSTIAIVFTVAIALLARPHTSAATVRLRAQALRSVATVAPRAERASSAALLRY